MNAQFRYLVLLVVAALLVGAASCQSSDGAVSEPDDGGIDEGGQGPSDAGDGSLPNDDAETSTGVCDAGQPDPNFMQNAVQIGLGLGFTCALRADSTVACWGQNDKGQLGYPDFPSGGTPRPYVIEGLSGVTQISVGSSHVCGLKTVGTNREIWCWGNNNYKQLGHSFTASTSFIAHPATNADGSTIENAVAVSAGVVHTCAILDGGNVACWGGNSLGEVLPIDGGSVDASAPIQGATIVLTGGVTQIATGIFHTCALQSGVVKCWGDNGQSELGVAPTDGGAAPLTTWPVNTGSASILQLAVKGFDSCALDSAKNVYCSGNNNYGQAGEAGVGGPVFPPSHLLSLSGGVVALTAGWVNTCVLKDDGSVACVGGNSYGQLGNGANTNGAGAAGVIAPQTVLGVADSGSPAALGSVLQLDLGGSYFLGLSEVHACALTKEACGDGASVVCWGANDHGELGDGTLTMRKRPIRVLSTPQ